MHETYEETGQLIVSFESQCHNPSTLEGSRQWAFIAKLDQLLPITLSEAEHDSHKWFSANKIENGLSIHPDMLETYRQALGTSEKGLP